MALPTLTDGVVTLDPLRQSDADRLVECEDDAIRWAWRSSEPITLDRARSQIADGQRKWARGSLFRRFAIRAESDDVLAGTVYLHPSNRGTTVVDLWVCPDRRRAGYAMRAVRLALGYAFGELGVDAVEVEVRRGNEASLALARRLGFECIAMTQFDPRASRDGPDGDRFRLQRDAWEARATADRA